MSDAGDPTGGPALAEWVRLERAAEDAIAALAAWRTRALEAEREAIALRDALEGSLAAGQLHPAGGAERLHAENVALRSRIDEARRRMEALYERLRVLEARR